VPASSWQDDELASTEPSSLGPPRPTSESTDPAVEATRQFRRQVFPEELGYVRARRTSHGLAAEGDLDPAAGIGNNLTGLALSGGGIRSATFNLGLLQALSLYGLFEHFDYLSTVSGGGFIGSSVTALMSEEARKGVAPGVGENGRQVAGRRSGRPAPFPFPCEERGAEPDTVKYLRRHSDYLAPQGLTDYVRAFALLARGVALNLGLLLPILLIASLVGTFLFMDDLMAAARRDVEVESLRRQPGGAQRQAADGLPTEGPGAPPVEPRPAGPRQEVTEESLSASPPATPVLLYGAARGLRAVGGRFGNRPFRLWTEASPVAAARLGPHPETRQIAAVGHDGWLWLFYPEAHGAELRRESGRVRAISRAPVPVSRLEFTADGCRLVGTAPDGTVVSWTVGLRLEPGADYCQPLAGGARAIASPEVASDGEPTEMPAGRLMQAADGPGWEPGAFHLPITAGSLVLVLLGFVGIYPFAAILAGPLELLVDGLSKVLRRGAARLRRARPSRGVAAARRSAAGGSRDLAAATRVAGSVVVMLPLVGLIEFVFAPDGGAFSGSQRLAWPLVGFSFVALCWLLSVVLLAPPLRHWRTSPMERPAGGAGASRWAKTVRCSLILLVPWGLLVGLLALLEPGGRAASVAGSIWAWSAVPFWQLVLGWWLACVGLLMPLLGPSERLQVANPEVSNERHRQLTGRLYAAANLLPWIFAAHFVFSPLPRDLVEYLIQTVLYGFGVTGSAVAGRLASFTLLGFFAGVQFSLWKAFALLAHGRSADAKEASEGATANVGGPTSAAAASGAGSPMVWRERYEKALSLAVVVVAAIALVEVQPYLVYHYHRLSETYPFEWLYYVAAAWFVAVVLAAMFLEAFRGLGKKLVLVLLGILGPLLPILVYLTFVEILVYDESWFDLRWVLFGPVATWARWARLAFYTVTVAVVAYLVGKLVDANATGMHGFYRDRLSRAYLVGVDRDGALGPEDELSLQEICQEGTGAPYHLVNASLNMQRAKAGAQRWRHSDFFVFSRYWCGGPSSQYCRTEHLEYLAPGVHLGSAMAVSAAAAAPNMGARTSRLLVMLMTLLNVRLGLWLPTPRRVRRLQRLGVLGSGSGFTGWARRWWLRLRNRPSGYYLVQEMASRLDASGPFVNLSDGGHLENTAVYELLRRRCRFIVASDVESDPAMRFGSLAALMRYASIDLGVEIELDLEPLRPGPDGTSSSHWVVGRIHYPPLREGGEDEIGLLLYIKASVVGTESEVIREYRTRHPDFPQESTADQLFEEDQFEAYRALGFQIGAGLFETRRYEPFTSPTDIENWLLPGLDRPPAAG
jgi:predicted acylesterase/phospholipase RssA